MTDDSETDDNPSSEFFATTELEPGLHCMSNEDGFSLIPDRTVDLIMADGPYYISDNSQPFQIGGFKKVASFGGWDTNKDASPMMEIFKESARTLRYGGSIIVWTGWEFLGTYKEMMIEAGLFPKRLLTWVKPNVNPVDQERGFLHGTEHAIWATNAPSWKSHTFRSVKGRMGWIEAMPHRGEGRIHDCQKPTEVYHYFMNQLIIPFKGQVVVEPFAGSAPAAHVAKVLGCKYYGFEKNLEMVLKARKLRRI